MAVVAAALIAGGAAAQARTALELALVDGELPAAARTVRVRKGDEVEFKWTSDRHIVLHLHGYDLEATVMPGASARMAFSARLAGRFPVTEHARGKSHHRTVLYLEVHP